MVPSVSQKDADWFSSVYINYTRISDSSASKAISDYIYVLVLVFKVVTLVSLQMLLECLLSSTLAHPPAPPQPLCTDVSVTT